MSAQIISFQGYQSKAVKQQHNANSVEGDGSLRSLLLDVSGRVDETVNEFENELSPFIMSNYSHLFADLKGVALLLRAISDA